MINKAQKSSFRDSKNFVFEDNGISKRQINPKGFDDFYQLMKSKLYDDLTAKNLLIKHQIEYESADKIVICPQQIPFISYPYEWSFSMLRDAALLTLKVLKISLDYGMILKDASAYNVQFLGGKCIFMDTGSLEKYNEGEPWRAYGQFCEHFVAPLLLMSYCDLSLQSLLVTNLSGIPLAVAAKLLPMKAKIRPSIFMHIVLHAALQKGYEQKGDVVRAGNKGFSKFKLRALAESLESLLKSLKFPRQQTQWQDYYNDNNYSPKAFSAKQKIIKEIIAEYLPKTVWDMGANQGVFSRLSGGEVAYVDFDIDAAAIEENYLSSQKEGRTNILPLKFDFCNPSPDIGVGNSERMAIFKRAKPDMILFLALLHHLVIVYKIPFVKVAEVLSGLTKRVVLEFVLPEDSQVQRLVKSRNSDDFEYTPEAFKTAFLKYFEIEKEVDIPHSKRKIYVLTAQK